MLIGVSLWKITPEQKITGSLQAVTTELVVTTVVGVASFTQAIAQGANVGDALIAGVSSAALTYVGGSMFPAGGIGLDAAAAGFVATVGTVGGMSSVLQGGKFGHGFVSAGIGGDSFTHNADYAA